MSRARGLDKPRRARRIEVEIENGFQLQIKPGIESGIMTHFLAPGARLRSLLLVAAAACAGGGGAAGCMAGAARLPTVTPADVVRGSEQYPDLTADELAQGRTLVARKCGACHLPPRPTSHPALEWPAEVRHMKQRAHLDDRQAQLIERYLVTMASPQRSLARQ
jgi:hypothetical protein